MRNLIIGSCFTLTACMALAQSEEIATCRSPSGTAYFHYSAGVDKAGSGWTDDKISKGVFTLVRAKDGSFDVLYIDGRSKPISSTQDGAMVRVLRSSSENLTLLVYYERATTEIYSFFKEKDGKSKFSMLTNKTGNGALIQKSSVMVGDCDPIRFNLIR